VAVLELDMATIAPLIKGKECSFPRAINGGTELDAAVASDTALLMTAQKWKWPSSLSWCRPLNRRRRQSGRDG
jgi:hypothetical protein